MAGYNRIVLMGNLTRDPEYKQLQSGQGVCRLGLATNRQFKNRQSGSMTQEVCFIDVDVWGAQAESCRQYLQKGRSVLVEGRLKFDSWEDPNGQTRSKHSIVADRVVFLTSGGAEVEAEDETLKTGGITPAVRRAPRAEPSLSSAAGVPKAQQDALEKDLLSQIDKLKAKTQPKKQASMGGEIEFHDQPPFEDDLPF